MNAIFKITIFTLMSVASVARNIEQQQLGNYYQYTKYKAALSWEQIMGDSLDMAVESCQKQFKWQRWNCASSDFFLRRTSSPTLLDLEDVFVSAIATAAILYTLTKECASGVVAGCGCDIDSPSGTCADEPAKAVKLYEARFTSDGSGSSQKKGFLSEVGGHNHRAVVKLLLDSLVTECTGSPAKCIQVLKPFDTLAEDLRRMYDNAVQLGTTGSNLKIIWANIPLDTFAYMKDSPNYCEPDAEAHWPGTRGRQCSHQVSTDNEITTEQRQSCNHLCRSCGYRVRSQLVRTERACKCKVIWGFRLHCQTCVETEREYFCY